MIYKLATEKGLDAEIEHILPNLSRVDVAIFGKKKIAVEISVTTSVKHEVSNIQKCLNSFDLILVVSDTENHLKNIEKSAGEILAENEFSKLDFLTPDNFIEKLEQYFPAKTKTVNGFKVKVSRKTLTPKEQRERKEVIASVIASSIKATN